jgi:phenylpropionate dioxygenase-like ring-hydroxylating dioxygenase large terminal subunit
LSSSDKNKISFKNFWYIACLSKDLKKKNPIHRQILDDWIALFRDDQGRAVALQDRCIHRNYRLSEGDVIEGNLRCPYHGWSFDREGVVANIPSEGPEFKKINSRCVKKYELIEQDDAIYVCLDYQEEVSSTPHFFPHYGEKGYKTVRLFNEFENDVTNCAENYIDVPHTVFVHDGIFRTSRQQKFQANVERKDGSVKTTYHNETDNLGWFSWFLNPKKEEIYHADFFLCPNVTSVVYRFGTKNEFYITSHCVPVSENKTHVYTDLTFKFGLWNFFAAPIVRYQGQSVIDQDIEVLNQQMEVIQKYGRKFQNSKADIIHVLIESIRESIEKGENPYHLSPKTHNFNFWI